MQPKWIFAGFDAAKRSHHDVGNGLRLMAVSAKPPVTALVSSPLFARYIINQDTFRTVQFAMPAITFVSLIMPRMTSVVSIL